MKNLAIVIAFLFIPFISYAATDVIIKDTQEDIATVTNNRLDTNARVVDSSGNISTITNNRLDVNPTLGYGTGLTSIKTPLIKANTATVIGPSTNCYKVIVGSISSAFFVGDSSVTPNNGIYVTTGGSITLEVGNINQVYFTYTANTATASVLVITR